MTRRRIIYTEPTLEQAQPKELLEPEINIVEKKPEVTGYINNDFIWIFFIIILIIFLFGGFSFKY